VESGIEGPVRTESADGGVSAATGGRRCAGEDDSPVGLEYDEANGPPASIVKTLVEGSVIVDPHQRPGWHAVEVFEASAKK
jgi:hypothetical protein